MNVKAWSILSVASVAVIATAPARAQEVDFNKILNADQNPNDWLTYHGSFKSWHYSPLRDVDMRNVDKLRIAWIHQPSRTTRGVQSMPLAADGVLYYSSSYSQVYA